MRTGLATLAMLVLGAVGAEAQDCGLKQYDSLPMAVNPERLLLPVTFGTTPKQMVFRMDFAANALSTGTVEALDLRRTSMPPNLTFHRDGVEIRYIAHAPEVILGRQTLKAMEFLEVPTGRYTDTVVGDIGTHMFEKMDFELDMAGGKLNLFSPDHCPGKTVYWTRAGFAQVPIKPSEEMGYIRVPMTLDGQPVTVALSTTGRSRIGMNAMRRLFNIDETSPELVAVDQDLLGHKLYRFPFKTLTADGLTVSNPEILVYDETPRPECKDKLHFAFPDHDAMHSTDRARLVRCFGGEDAVLGLSVLKKLHLYVSSREKLLYLTSAEAK